jgi:hypothetical protein
MIKRFALLILLGSFFVGMSQNQATWKIYFEPQKLEVGKTEKLVLDADVAKGWHIYGTEDGCKGMGPLLW